jgi:hypothetical protein
VRRYLFFALIILFLFTFLNKAFSETATATKEAVKKEPVFVGEFFNIQVPIQNYYFIRGVIAVFGNKWGAQPESNEDLEQVIWEQLLMSFEAFRRGITVSEEEIDGEIGKILAAEKVEFDWKKDRDAYEKWVKDKTGEPAEIFEGQLRHLLQLHKLRQQAIESTEPAVSEQEAYQEFLNEHNNLGVELAQFEDEKEAMIFYKKAKAHPKFWDEEKEKRPKDFKRPGNVALEFLMDIWGFPKEAAYKMMKAKISSIYPAAPIYKGYAVFKILTQRHADKSYYKRENVRKSYYGQIRDRKRIMAFQEWFQDLKKQAHIQKYDKIIRELTKGEISDEGDIKNSQMPQN